MPKPKLKIAGWQSALDEVAPPLEDYQSWLTAMSDDIRALEKYLVESGFRIPTMVPVGNGNARLGWIELGNGWRISYLTVIPGKANYTGQPLIETPVTTRSTAAAAVPVLLREIAKVARVKLPKFAHGVADDEPLTDDDIPF